jgi:acyl dehydratase
MWTLSTLIGLSVAQLTQGTLVAQLGLTDVSFPAPLFVGDTLTAETEVVSVRPSASRPGQGVVVLAHTGCSQNDEVVVTATRTVLVWAKDGAE